MGDITERKEREQRLMVLNRVLRHNLRNKLTIVSGYAEALDGLFDGYDATGSFEVEQARGHTAKIVESAGELVDLGEKARQFEQAVEGSAVTSTVAVTALLEELAAEYRAQHPDATLELRRADQQFTGSVEFLELAVRELVDNAVTHSETPSPTVELGVSPGPGDQFEITVADDGPGIPQVEAKILTEGEETSLLHGSGVGLWTVNWLITRIGGRISIAEADGSGTVVTLTVPEEGGQ